MDESIANLPTSDLLGSVPAVIPEGKSTGTQEVPGANLQTFPPASGGNAGQSYQTMGGPTAGFPAIYCSFCPDFLYPVIFPISSYGLIWISTTLVFVIAAVGNCATYLIQKRSNGTASWIFDVNYFNVATIAVYGYAFLVPLALYFLLQYMGSKTSLIRFWCLWGYSLFIFILTSCFLIIPVEFLRWTVALISGAMSACFVTLNLRSYLETNDVTPVLAAAFALQRGFAIFIKMWFFP